MNDKQIPVLEDIVQPDEPTRPEQAEVEPAPPARLSAAQLEAVIEDVVGLLSSEINKQLGSLLLEFQTDLRQQLPERVRGAVTKRLGTDIDEL